MSLFNDFETIILIGIYKKDNYVTFKNRGLITLKEEYFKNKENKILFKIFFKYWEKYNSIPEKSTIIKLLADSKLVNNEDTYNKLIDKLNIIVNDIEEYEEKWLIDSTEEFIKKYEIEKTILKTVEDINNKKLGENVDVTKVLADFQDIARINLHDDSGIEFSFDEKEMKNRHEIYTKVENKLPFPETLEKLNLYTDGGITRKTLNMLLCPTNAGKTTFKIFLASQYITQGYNVGFITLEMAEDKIMKRVESSCLKEKTNDLSIWCFETYKSKLEKIKKQLKGRFFVKEYPTASINVNHIRALLKEWELKNDFVPDILIIDYLNILTSSRVKGDNSYNTVKAISEEVRGLAVEKNMVIWSSTQSNRSGMSNSTNDIDYEQTSDSIGTAFTVDLLIGMFFKNDEMKNNGIQEFKIIKNRYDEYTKIKFSVNVNFASPFYKQATVEELQELNNQDFNVLNSTTNNFDIMEKKANINYKKSSLNFDKEKFTEDLEF